MTKSTNGISRAEKIISFLYEYGKGKKIHIRFEDVVVGLFKKYPGDFHLKGYKEYPDSGDLVHKPLYDFKKKGYLIAANKVFTLTDRGLEYARRIIEGGSGEEKSGERLSRSATSEMDRIKRLEGFSLFSDGRIDQLSENDFYNYLAVSVRTDKNAFAGRMETVKAAIAELKAIPSDRLYSKIVEYHEYIMTKYGNLTDFFTGQK